MSSPQTPLTFGLELEFILAHPLLPSTSRAQLRDTHIRRPLRAAGLRVQHADQYDDETGLPRYGSWRVDRDSSVVATYADLQANGCTFANGQKFAPTHDTAYTCVEVISRVLPLSMEALGEVRTAVGVIREAPTFVTSTAGLHVHVGRGTAGFELAHLQNLVALMACFEPQFDQLVAPHRVGAYHCQSLRKTMFAPVARRSRAHMARTVFATQSVKELADRVHVHWREYGKIPEELYHHQRAKALNLSNLHPDFNYSSVKKTVEFRQQAGSLDAGEVERWVETVCAIVRVAGEVSADDILDIINQHTAGTSEDGEEQDDWGLSILELVADLGIGFLAPLWERSLYPCPLVGVEGEDDVDEGRPGYVRPSDIVEPMVDLAELLPTPPLTPTGGGGRDPVGYF